jgi:hypothetical protein
MVEVVVMVVVEGVVVVMVVVERERVKVKGEVTAVVRAVHVVTTGQNHTADTE